MAQFDRRTHRAREHLINAGKMYPQAWVLADAYRAGRGSDYPHWPDWCYLAIGAAAGIVASDARVPITQLPMQYPERIPDAARLAALTAWRMTQGIYRFDPWLYAALIDTPVTGDLPADVLLRMPEWCVYIESPGQTYGGQPLHGFWAHLEYDHAGRTELRLLLDGDNIAAGLLPIPIHVAGGLQQGVEAFIADSRRRADAIGMGSLMDLADRCGGAGAIRAAIEPLVSLLLYLCSAGSDLTRRGQPAAPANPEPTRTRRHGWRLFPVDGPREWDVGVRVGAALRAAYQREQTGGDAAPTGRHVRPHVRRAHWHTILSGPRLRDGESIPSSERNADLRWMPPLPINVDDVEVMPSTIRPVR